MEISYDRECSVCGTLIYAPDKAGWKYKTLDEHNKKKMQCCYICNCKALGIEPKLDNVDKFNKKAIDQGLSYGQLQVKETVEMIRKMDKKSKSV